MDKRITNCIESLKEHNLLSEVGGNWDLPSEICELKSDSRIVGPGDIFACVVGEHADGHDFIPQVLASGAAGLILQRPVPGLPVPWICVKNVRKAMGYIAASLFGRPSDKLKMFGVTGTQGKSTTSYMMRSILAGCGVKCGLLGTIVYDDGEKTTLADRTTPEGDAVQKYLHRMLRSGCAACSMECSSHGIEQGRLSGCMYDGVVFTNLTPEHLDYHGTMENYFNAKMELFHSHLKEGAIVAPNVADEYGRRVADEFPGAMTWALGAPARLRAENLGLSMDGGAFDLLLDGEFISRVRIPLAGRYNIENALGAAAVCLGAGCSPEAVVRGLEKLPQVPGRMERINLAGGRCAIIDFAHTGDSLKALLTALRSLTDGRIISVFGHGGDRFSGHRPVLGKVAAERADRIIVTMDNPRTEDPVDIARSIGNGIKSVRNDDCFVTVLPREAAIKRALDECAPGDVVVITGKGPEPYMEIQGIKYPYSDKGVVVDWAREKGVDIL